MTRLSASSTSNARSENKALSNLSRSSPRLLSISGPAILPTSGWLLIGDEPEFSKHSF